MKIRIILCIASLLFLSWNVDAGICKSDLKVLYVGGLPDFDFMITQHDSLEIAENVTLRMASFEKMLKQYFKHVTVIHAENYTPALSKNYDVTVMDGIPLPIEQAYLDENGYWVKAKYLPDDFNGSMLMIAQVSNEVGSRIGLKFDEYCNCLYDYALRIRAEHPIFKGPFPVKMTMVTRQTPEQAKKMYDPQGEAGIAPDSLPMWRVQTASLHDREGMRPGLITRSGGFEDSPDAEFISGGESAKSLDAVAIGRHGNFLHWGFAASPADMTEEAKNVFANAIVYIAQFAGQTPIARGYRDMITRDAVGSFIFAATDKAYQESLKFQERVNKGMEEQKKEVQEKKARGEKLEKYEEYQLNWQSPEPATYEEYLQKEFGDLYLLYGTDESGYVDYFDNNLPYFLPKATHWGFIIDEDARSLGIPNNEVCLLDKAISLWETGEDTHKARRLLNRYTLCHFETPAEWRTWFETNKSRLFFTESGGWIFMVNTRDKNEPANDYSVWEKSKQPEIQQTQSDETDERNPVKVSAAMEELPNGNHQIVVRLKIHKGFHIYTHVAQGEPFLATKIEFKLPSNVRIVGDLRLPAGKAYSSAGTLICEDEAIFRQEIMGMGVITCSVTYQCCNDQICMPPVEQVLTVD